MISLQYTHDGMLHLVENPDSVLVQAHIEGLLADTPQSIMFYTPFGLLIVSGETNRQIGLKLKDEVSYSDATSYMKLLSGKDSATAMPPVEKPTRYAVISAAEAIKLINHLITAGEFPVDWAWAG